MRSRKILVVAALAALLAVGTAGPAGADAEPLPPLPANGSAVPTVTPAQLNGCNLFPADTVFHADVRNAPALTDSDARLDAYEAVDSGALGVAIPTAVWGYAGERYGTPINTATATTTRQRIYIDDPWGSWFFENGHPIPPGMDVTDGFDQHGLVLETSDCRLFEYLNLRYWGFWLFGKWYGWVAHMAANWDLDGYSYFYRGSTPKSATATGMPILPFLLRPAEVSAGRIDHPLRFTIPNPKQGEAWWPARSTDGSSTASGALPEGVWLRLKADFPETGMNEEAKTIIRALKVHGMILGDVGGNTNKLTIGAQASSAWDSGNLATALTQVTGALSSIYDTNSDHIWEIVDANDFKIATTSLQVN